jgi:hypothetical protein
MTARSGPMAPRVLVPLRKPSDWKALLGDPDRHWRAGYSAMATASSWLAAEGLPPEIKVVFGPAADLLLAIPEHRVPMPGRGADSQCDVFALVRSEGQTHAVAIEAKVHESFDKTLAEWQSDGSPGKTRRLEGICAILGCSKPPGHLRYQLFHRTAAAVVEARRFSTEGAAMIVQSFAPDHRWSEDFMEFSEFLGARASPGNPATLTRDDGLFLRLAWVSGDPRFLQPLPD